MGKIIRRILTIIPAVALQSLWLLLLMKWLTPYAPIIVSLLSVAAFFLVVFIIIKRDETAYKLLWLPGYSVTTFGRSVTISALWK